MSAANRSALRVAVVYAVVSVAWILVTGWLANLLPGPVARQVEYLKGIFFVLTTALILYVLIYAWSARFTKEAEHAVDAEKRLDGVVKTVPVGVLMVDARTAVTLINPAATEMLGITASQAIGRPLADLFTQSGAYGPAAADEMLREGTAVGVGVGAGGGSEARAMVARSAPLDATSGGGGWVVAIADISEERRESQRLLNLASGYRFVSVALGEAWRSESADDTLQGVCDAAVDVGGYRSAFAVRLGDGSSDVRLVARRDLGAATQKLFEEPWDAETQGIADLKRWLGTRDIYVQNDAASWDGETWRRIALADGYGSVAVVSIRRPHAVIGVAFVAASTEFFDHDQVVLLGTVRDGIAFEIDRLALDRRRLEAEEALGRSEQRYRELFRTNPQVMWVYDADTLRFIEVNDAAVAKYGYSRDDFLKMSIKDIRPQAEIDKLEHHLRREPSGFGDSGYWTHVDATGRAFPVHVTRHSVNWDERSAVLVQVEEVARFEG